MVSAPGYRDFYGTYKIIITSKYVSIPSAYGSYTYDGTTKTATQNNYSSTYMTRSGTTSAINAGTYTITYTLRNTTYTKWADGTTAPKTYTWTIAKRNLSDPAVAIADIPDQNYTGSAITPEPAVTFNGRTLVKGTDFTYSYDNNVTSGTASVIISAVAGGNYNGTATKTFNIIAHNISASANGYSGVYDGTAHTGTVNLPVSKPYHIKDKTNGAATVNQQFGNAGQGGFAPPQGGFAQQAGGFASQNAGNGTSVFVPMSNDEEDGELPF